uniref:Nuclear pore complex protein GP210 n=1 Tax=Nicotiana tabacum TaxID=4097 RepID=A0A1S4AHP8_TOBAC|nr:PREDICTED: nuclear pore complex protein GP210-like [Nicotiana tabacum]
MLLHFLSLLLLLFPLATPFPATGPHIADVNILLPPKMTHPVEYRLQGSDGCFKWTWDHHDILAVLPEYNVSSQCSTSARLKSIAPYSGRKETAVYATDVHTGAVIRCKVYVDNFSRIQIFHSSVKLDLDGLATLRVRAFDSEENVFSSLVGIQFTWHLMPETDGLPHHLTHIPLKDSPLSDCGGLCGDLDIQIKLENSGVFSDLYVVKGTEIGHEIVSVHLDEPSVKYMEDKIVLTVAEAISLEPPSPVCVLIGAIVHYSLKVIRGNIPQLVTLPSAFHRWSVSNSSVAQVDRMVGTAKALNLGITTVTVEDTRVVGHTQVSSFHVVLPDSLSLYMLPLSLSGDHVKGIEPIPSVARWYVVSGREYLIQVRIFSKGTWVQEVYISENDDVKLHGDSSEIWSIIPSSNRIGEKGVSRILKALSCGLGKLTATLTYCTGHEETKEVLKVVQEVMVCDQVKFSMEGVSDSITLPWAPGVYQELELKVTGGCAMVSGDYRWFSSDMSIVSVSASGIVQAKRPGKVTIKAVSVFDSLNYDEIVVEVSLPSLMIVLPNFPVETPVGSYLRAAVTFKTLDGDLFYKCDAFSPSIKWKTGSDAFLIVDAGETFISEKQEILPIDTEKYGPPCAWTYVYASNSGQTMLHATLSKEFQQYDHYTGGSVVLQATSRIAAFMPLIVHPASDGNQFGGYWFNLVQAEADDHLDNMEHLYLAPGTYFDVMLRGGPNRWDQGVEFVESVESLDEHNLRVQDGLLVSQEFTSYGSTYRIKCQDVGNFRLLLKRGNLIGEGHPLPAVSEVQLSLTCGFLASIALIADETVNSVEVIQSAAQADRGSGRIRTTPITIANGRTVRLSAVGISESGIAFGNSSSLPLKWELKDCDDLAFWDDIHNLAMLSNWERYLVLANATGLCVVRATVIGPVDLVSHRHSLKHIPGPENDLTDAIRLQLVSSLRVYPEFSLLYLNHDARLNLSITGGSCFIDAAVNDTQVMEITQPAPGLQCTQLLLAPKKLGTALVTVRDVGLAPPLSAFSVVQVADVDWIKIKSGEELSIMEGSSLSINFLAGVNDGNTFDSSQYVYMNIRVHIEDHIVELVNEDDLSCCDDGYVIVPNFRIRAMRLGITTLYVSARQHTGHEILSQPIKVEVYAPPRIHPSDIFLVPGASYVLTVRGGPKTGAYIKFVSMDNEVAKVHTATGRVSATSPGNSTIAAKIYRNGDIFICQAYGEVKVGVPSSAMLNVQSEQLAVGRQIPIFPSLSEGNLFSFYELCRNYKWAIDDEEVLSFQAADDLHGGKNGMLLSSEKGNGLAGYVGDKDLGFIQVLHGRSAGQTDVTVSFSCDFVARKSFSQSRLYTASISLSVVPELPLALGSPITWILPPHYTTSDLLPSASKTFSKGDPSMGKVTYSILGDCRRKGEREEDDPILIDGSRIRTKESGNLACIQAKDRSNGRVEVASCVKVAEVTQVRFTSEKLLVHTLAIGAEIDVPIKYYDVLGNPFHEAHDVFLFGVETNYRDVISVEDAVDGNGNVHLRAISHGRALVRVGFANDLEKSDYVVILVGAHLHPQDPTFHLGSGLNFSIEGLNDQVSGQWFSSNTSIVSVDQLSGHAKAIGEGSARIIFESSNMKLQTTVTVSQPEMMSVDAPREVLTNVPLPANGYSFHVKLNDAHGHKYKSAKNRAIFLFDCLVDPPYVGYVKPWVDLDTGSSYCLFFPYSPEHLVLATPKSGDTRLDLAVTIKASLIGEQNISGSASALFVGGFIILGTEGDSLQLNLTPEYNKSVLTVVGNTDVNIYWHDQERLAIRPIYGEDSQGGSRAQYEVKIRRAEKFKDKLIFTLPATGQRMEVNVCYEPEERRATSANLNLWSAAAVCFILMIFTATLFICYLDQPVRSRPTAPPGTPRVAAPATPERSSPAVVNEHSPRTPQPFLDYVRRTIDETPYYRQDFRRRANPQNTY